MKAEFWYPTAFSLWEDEEHVAITRVLASGRFTMGAEVAAFEREFAAYHDTRHAIMVNSGSSANLVAIAALFHVKHNPLKRGDVAIVPALAWSTTYAPLVQYGLNLTLVDCDETWNADILSFEFNAPTPARLVVGCSILGNPASIDGVQAVAKIKNAYFFEDNCESLGAAIQGRVTGGFGLMSTSSFFYSHQVSGIEGGMILTDDEELAMLCRMLRAHGWTRDVQPPASFDQEYDFRLFGYNVRPLELHAAVSREQFRKLPRFVAARRANAEVFRQLTADLPIRHPVVIGKPSPFGLNFTVEDRPTRARLAEALRARGIDCRLPTGGSFTQHAYGAPWARQATPQADRVHYTGLFLGNAPFDITDRIEAAVKVMKEVL